MKNERECTIINFLDENFEDKDYEFEYDEVLDEKLYEEKLYKLMLEDGIFLDEEIKNAIENGDPFWLNEYLGISLEKASEICEEVRLYGKMGLRNLKTIMFARDRKALDIKIEKVTGVDLASEDLGNEFEVFNDKMSEKNTSAVKVEGINGDGKRVVLYYYPGSLFSNQYEMFRQMRVYNECGDIEAIQEQILFANGIIGSPICALAAYKYDENGNKKFSLYEDEIFGGRYYEYDENGKIVYLLTERDGRYVTAEMSMKLMNACVSTRPDFECMDNSALEESLNLFSGDVHKKINNDERVYDDR